MARKRVNWIKVKHFYLHSFGTKADATRATLKEFGISRAGLWNYAGPEEWEKLRQHHQQALKLQKANVVDFKSIDTKGKTPGQQRRDQLTIVNDAIDGIGNALSCIDYQDLGKAAGGANALVKLLEYRKTVAPSTAHELVEAAISAGIEPKEFIEILSGAWQQRA